MRYIQIKRYGNELRVGFDKDEYCVILADNEEAKDLQEELSDIFGDYRKDEFERKKVLSINEELYMVRANFDAEGEFNGQWPFVMFFYEKEEMLSFCDKLAEAIMELKIVQE